MEGTPLLAPTTTIPVTTPTKLPSPPTRDSTIVPEQETHHLHRERAFSPSANINEILRNLRETHATGTLSVDINEGGVGSIRFSERKKVTFE